MKYSQNGEEQIIETLFDYYGITPEKFCVELGAGDGFHLSNTRYFLEKGWKSIMIDKDSRGNADVNEFAINAENINDILKGLGCPKEFDLLSVDLDGNDFWILKKILQEFSPKLIIAEYNACFPIEESKTIKYNPDHVWSGDDYFGFTLKAGEKLAQENNYKIVYENANMNIYLLRKDFVTKPDLIDIKYELNTFFNKSNRTDWETV